MLNRAAALAERHGLGAAYRAASLSLQELARIRTDSTLRAAISRRERSEPDQSANKFDVICNQPSWGL